MCEGETGPCPINHEHWHGLKAPQVLRAHGNGQRYRFPQENTEGKNCDHTQPLPLCPALSLPRPPKEESTRSNSFVYSSIRPAFRSPGEGGFFVQPKGKGPRLSGSTEYSSLGPPPRHTHTHIPSRPTLQDHTAPRRDPGCRESSRPTFQRGRTREARGDASSRGGVAAEGKVSAKRELGAPGRPRKDPALDLLRCVWLPAGQTQPSLGSGGTCDPKSLSRDGTDCEPPHSPG